MLKLTKNELRDQEHKLQQLQQYLPTLQLKKAMLQTEVNQVGYEITKLTQSYHRKKATCESFQLLLADSEAITLLEAIRVDKVERWYENVAGAAIPYFKGVTFISSSYSLFHTPLWVDSGIQQLKALLAAKAELGIAKEKLAILEGELREVSIRVNLFEKILIPRTQRNIKKIRVFLGDQELAFIAQAKIAKAKILLSLIHI